MSLIDSEPHRRVLTLLDRGQADQDAFAAHISNEERAARGELHSWSAKDQIAHNNFWRKDAIWRLQAARDGTNPPDTDDEQKQNDRVFRERRDAPWDELVTETQRLHAETAGLSHQLTPDDLAEKDRYPWQHGASLETLIFVNWYDQPAEHWADFYIRGNELDRALELRGAVATTVRELFPDKPKMYSYMLYKLGSLSAGNGRAEQAIDSLREALTVNPSLIDWVRNDSSLDSVRTMPAFRSLGEGLRERGGHAAWLA